jgi:hypothetical protein
MGARDDLRRGEVGAAGVPMSDTRRVGSRGCRPVRGSRHRLRHGYPHIGVPESLRTALHPRRDLLLARWRHERLRRPQRDGGRNHLLRVGDGRSERGYRSVLCARRRRRLDGGALAVRRCLAQFPGRSQRRCLPGRTRRPERCPPPDDHVRARPDADRCPDHPAGDTLREPSLARGSLDSSHARRRPLGHLRTGPGGCTGGECTPTVGEPCHSSVRCAPGQRCSAAGVCERQAPSVVASDPGACSVRSPPPRDPRAWLWITAVALSVARLRRRVPVERPTSRLRRMK